MAVGAPPVCGQWETRTNLPTGLFSTLDSLGGVGVVSKDDVWFAGAGHDAFADREERTIMLHWDGKELSQVESPSPYAYAIQLNDITVVSKNDIWAAGWYGMDNSTNTNVLLMHWDGSAWSIPAGTERFSGMLNAIAVDTSNVVWGAGESPISTNPYPMLIKWDGVKVQRVSLQGLGISEAEFNDVVALAPDDMWVVGSSPDGTLFLHWDGSVWRKVDGPKLCKGYHYLHSVSALAPDNIWAVGACSDANTYDSLLPRRDLIAQYDGSKWSLVAGPDSQLNGTLYGMTALAPDDIWAIGTQHVIARGNWGTFLSAGTTQVLHWDGRMWSLLASPNPSQKQYLVNIDASTSYDLWSVGSYGSANILDHSMITEFVRSACEN